MTVHIVIVSYRSPSTISLTAPDDLVSVDVYECRYDAQARYKRAQTNFPKEEGFTVVLLEKPVALGYSAVAC